MQGIKTHAGSGLSCALNFACLCDFSFPGAIKVAAVSSSPSALHPIRLFNLPSSIKSRLLRWTSWLNPHPLIDPSCPLEGEVVLRWPLLWFEGVCAETENADWRHSNKDLISYSFRITPKMWELCGNFFHISHSKLLNLHKLIVYGRKRYHCPSGRYPVRKGFDTHWPITQTDQDGRKPFHGLYLLWDWSIYCWRRAARELSGWIWEEGSVWIIWQIDAEIRKWLVGGNTYKMP